LDSFFLRSKAIYSDDLNLLPAVATHAFDNIQILWSGYSEPVFSEMFYALPDAVQLQPMTW
jgi:hypothetical protein